MIDTSIENRNLMPSTIYKNFYFHLDKDQLIVDVVYNE